MKKLIDITRRLCYNTEVVPFARCEDKMKENTGVILSLPDGQFPTWVVDVTHADQIPEDEMRAAIVFGCAWSLESVINYMVAKGISLEVKDSDLESVLQGFKKFYPTSVYVIHGRDDRCAFAALPWDWRKNVETQGPEDDGYGA